MSLLRREGTCLSDGISQPDIVGTGGWSNSVQETHSAL